MSFYLRPGLTAEAASAICMGQCRAQCCRGPLVLAITEEEVSRLASLGELLAVDVTIIRNPDGSGQIRFLDHPGEHCPFLDGATWACRIYADRPQRCRLFPQGPTPGCAISGG